MIRSLIEVARRWCAGDGVSRFRSRLAAAAVAVVAAAGSVSAGPQETPVIRKGDAAVTSFAGASAPSNPPKGMHPLDVTFIDVKKPTLQVFDLSKLGGPPTGQLATAPVRFEAYASQIGHVFAVTTDAPVGAAGPNIFVGATSLFGLQIIEPGPDGTPKRLVRGAPRAEWMAGQFGLDQGGGPGSIWKIDGATGAISLFSNVISSDLENAGPGIGGLAFDGLSGSLYATNLESGMIHRLDKNGRELEIYDHGIAGRTKVSLAAVVDDAKRMDIRNPAFNIEDPQTWGYTNSKRRVIAVAVENGRLYYSVVDGPGIWSVGLNVDGSFADDARLDIDVSGTPNGNPVTGLAFDGPDILFLSQRGESTGSYDYSTFARPQTSVVSRYKFESSSKSWSPDRDDVAIGLAPVYRATNGGVALNYGYDKQGNIDYGQCRQTLWTTGEQLRAGESGPSILNGLQGNDKSMLQKPAVPAARSGAAVLSGDLAQSREAELSAPSDVWFTDKDGKFEDPQVHAHIGAIAILTECDRSVAETKRPNVAPYVPGTKRTKPGIYIDKVCGPAIIGIETRCEITITNVGIEPQSPIVFTDAGSTLSGPGVNTPLLITSWTTDGADFVCSPVPSGSFTCLLPPESLLPGKSRTVTAMINTDPGFGAGSEGFINCATLDAPYHGQSCFKTGDGQPGGLKISKSGPASCAPGGNCSFKLSVTNNGALPFSGQVLLSDAMLINGVAPAPAPITGVSPSFGCTGGDPAALPIQCNMPLSLAAGASKAFNVTMTMPPGNFWAQNCFVITSPASPPPGAIADSGACAWVKVGNPPPLSNLAISKTAGPCAKNGANLVRCGFAISVKNNGPSPFSSVIALNETTSPTGSLISTDPALACTPSVAGASTCTSPAAIALNPGQSQTFNVVVDTPAVDVDAAACFTPNKITIASPLGAPQNFNATDDTANATADSALLEFFDPVTGLTTVICDPTNLKTTKAATGDCVKAGGGYECSYKVTITNMGPDPYKGPVNLVDDTPGATSVIANGSGWNCTNGASSAQCSQPPLTLAKGASLEIAVKATVPDNGQCSAPNRATMTFPPAGTRFNRLAGDDSDTATAAIPSPKCLEKPACVSPVEGEFASASGACVCEQGRTRDRAQRCIADATPVKPDPVSDKCPDGYPIPQNGNCPCPNGQTWDQERHVCNTACEPGPNEYRTAAGQCVCKSGYVPGSSGSGCVTGKDDDDAKPLPIVPRPSTPERPTTTDDNDRCDPGPHGYRTPNGRCVCKEGYERVRGECVGEREDPKCQPGPGEYRTSKGNCICKEGYERDNNGRCQEVIDCPPSMDYDERLGKCVRHEQPQCQPGPHEYRTSSGRCVCSEGYERSGSGQCEKIFDCPPSMDFDPDRQKCVPHEGPVREVCSSRQYLNANGRCECKQGYREVDGDCVEQRQPERCGPNEVMARDGSCSCREGYAGIDGLCVPERDKQPERPEGRTCPKGFVGTPPNCKTMDVPTLRPNDRPEVKQCPSGYEGVYPKCSMIDLKKPLTDGKPKTDKTDEPPKTESKPPLEDDTPVKKLDPKPDRPKTDPKVNKPVVKDSLPTKKLLDDNSKVEKKQLQDIRKPAPPKEDTDKGKTSKPDADVTKQKNQKQGVRKPLPLKVEPEKKIKDKPNQKPNAFAPNTKVKDEKKGGKAKDCPNGMKGKPPNCRKA